MPCVYIAVVGGSREEDAVCARAEAVGREIARQGAVLVCGGLGGVPGAAARGAHATEGTVLGILPGTDRLEAGEHVTLAVTTGLRDARNAVISRSADAVVAVGGSYGTLSEIAFALRFGRPVVGLGTWGLTPPAGGSLSNFVPAFGPSEAVCLALQLGRESLRERAEIQAEGEQHEPGL